MCKESSRHPYRDVVLLSFHEFIEFALEHTYMCEMSLKELIELVIHSIWETHMANGAEERYGVSRHYISEHDILTEHLMVDFAYEYYCNGGISEYHRQQKHKAALDVLSQLKQQCDDVFMDILDNGYTMCRIQWRKGRDIVVRFI